MTLAKLTVHVPVGSRTACLTGLPASRGRVGGIPHNHSVLSHPLQQQHRGSSSDCGTVYTRAVTTP